MSDVARHAGVSQPTVSLVLNDAPQSRVSDETRRRVLAAASELGYRVDERAKGLRLGRSMTLGFITDAVATTPFAGEMIKGAQQAAKAQRNLLLVVNTEGDRQVEEDAVELMLQHRVNGIVYSSWYHHGKQPPAQLHEVPSVLVNCFDPDNSLPALVPDEEQGGHDATAILVDKGHRRVAFINSVPESAESSAYATAARNEHNTGLLAPAPSRRLAGYHAALAEAGIAHDPQLVRPVEPGQEGGFTAMNHLLALDDRPSAVFCYNDRVAMGAYAALAENGLRVPDDMAVIGFDNQEVIAAHLRPPLSTMALPHYEMGRQATLRLLDNDPSDNGPFQPLLLTCDYVPRDSL